ncbi:B-4DMT family transporter [Mycolicibacterium lacusdiani]|uniref:B-4DMT family transporter n=1 Tax=Mycolicibacterium lacusdiani TaxID=2895283 RepID=UPI001F46080E|nr:B-4DMT family transporter [Mycolicibacterium lacusdiani]
MSKWLLRGLVFAALMVVVRLLQGALINAFESSALIISISLVVVYAVAAFIWGNIDGRADARANPDPDRRGDLAMTWLLAGLFAGVVSGFVAWLISLFYDNLYAEGLLNELTTFAAFTALLTFVAAIAGVTIGRVLVDRKAPPLQRRSAEDDRADTDVFAAVGARDYPDDGSTAEGAQAARTDQIGTTVTSPRESEEAGTAPTTTEGRQQP